jgi:non-ribosomal peptide synthetase component F
VTVLGAVPTMLSSINEEIPSLRLIEVGGEACPQNLVARWAKPGRRFLNTYGPTEATITATWAELEPGKPVTIGRPLPSYNWGSFSLKQTERYFPLGLSI